jgi:hypothetical protein
MIKFKDHKVRDKFDMKTTTLTNHENNANRLLAKVNSNVRGTKLWILEGKKMIIKRKGKSKSILLFFGYDISIKNNMLDFC